MAEETHRQTAADYAGKFRQLGMTWSEAARQLDVPERTLRHWRHARRPSPRRRGRPGLHVPLAVRNDVVRFLHHVSGPVVGIPALRALFPAVPRSVLEDLLRRYRRVWRRRYQSAGYRLQWHQPGRVWAMDHSRASQLIDRQYRQIFAVRDLASRQQLAWLPVRSTGLDEVLPILQGLFAAHGRPLVLKSDNGSAFRAEATSEWLLADSVVQLFSPAGYPQYNGQLERSNAVNKTYTHQRAVADGHPERWTAADLEHARTLTNTIARPWGHQGPTPDEAWRSRTAITEQERSQFAAEVTDQHACLLAERDLSTEPTSEEADDLQRRAVAAALQSCGYLTRQPVRRTPRPRKRLRRESLERRLRQFRQRTGAASDEALLEQPIAVAAQPIVVPAPPSVDAAVPSSAGASSPGDLPVSSTASTIDESVRVEHAHPAPLLDPVPRADTMQTVRTPSVTRLDTGPPNTTAHRERSNSTWWRRPITLLLNITKAANISH